jgi:ubiquinone biosynthesis protein Coq4
MNKSYRILTKLRSNVLVFLTHNMALPMLRFIRRPQMFPYSSAELKAFPAGTLGHDLIHFLHRKNLKLLPHYARHDIKHILLQYDTTGEGEVCLQCFMLGNGHLSFPVAATVLYGFVTMPEYWKKFRIAYRRGRQSIPIKNWQWFSILGQSTQSLINKINNNAKN